MVLLESLSKKIPQRNNFDCFLGRKFWPFLPLAERATGKNTFFWYMLSTKSNFFDNFFSCVTSQKGVRGSLWPNVTVPWQERVYLLENAGSCVISFMNGPWTKYHDCHSNLPYLTIPPRGEESWNLFFECLFLFLK